MRVCIHPCMHLRVYVDAFLFVTAVLFLIGVFTGTSQKMIGKDRVHCVQEAHAPQSPRPHFHSDPVVLPYAAAGTVVLSHQCSQSQPFKQQFVRLKEATDCA